MNTLDIIALVIFSVSVLICAIKGFLKLVANFGAICVAFLAARLVGGYLAELLLGSALGGFAVPLGTAVAFVLLLILCRIIFGALAKLITKLTGTKGLDKFLGALVGAVGGIAGIYVVSLVLGVVLAVIGVFEIESELPLVIENSLIFKYFM